MKVNGLKLPEVLCDHLKNGQWVNPGYHILAEVIPFLQDPMDFLTSVEAMERESKGALVDDPELSKLCHEYRGSKTGRLFPLPWRDVEKSVLIAVCRYAGDDTAVALDYRYDSVEPQVIASDILGDKVVHRSRSASSNFSTFAKRLGIL